MKTKDVSKSENFIINTDLDRFKGSPDWLMKALEDDLRIVAWIAWGLDLLFKDFDLEEMKSFIEHTTNEELKKYIREVDEEIAFEGKDGIILDKHYALWENNTVVGFLNIENQLDPYPYDELKARGFYYFCSITFWEKGQVIGIDENGKEIKLNSHNYRSLKPPTNIWINPNVAEKNKNTIDVLPLEIFTKDNGYKINTEIPCTNKILKSRTHQKKNSKLKLKV